VIFATAMLNVKVLNTAIMDICDTAMSSVMRQKSYRYCVREDCTTVSYYKRITVQKHVGELF